MNLVNLVNITMWLSSAFSVWAAIAVAARVGMHPSRWFAALAMLAIGVLAFHAPSAIPLEDLAPLDPPGLRSAPPPDFQPAYAPDPATLVRSGGYYAPLSREDARPPAVVIQNLPYPRYSSEEPLSEYFTNR